MNKIMTTSIIAGSMIGAGMVIMAKDKRTQRKMIRTGRNFVSKASDVVEDMTNMAK